MSWPLSTAPTSPTWVLSPTMTSAPGGETYLELRKIKIYNETIESIERLSTASAGDASLPTYPEYDLFRVHLAGGEVVERGAFFAKFTDELASSVGPDMGVRLDGGRLTADYAKGLITNIPGVYAVGDANTDGATNIPHALFSGKRAAIYLHVQLERETANAQIAAYKQERDVVEEEDVRALWERMNGEPGDLLYAGEYRE
uniref:FAD/NAD(P)-binding domain-containing protein n=1 Tax=Bionectria ochroleuca TaxID=29856 RepID=A0A8H7N6P9_BIOOC